MAFFLVQLLPSTIGHSFDGINACVVSAENAADARAACKSIRSGDQSSAAWDAATTTQLADVAASGANALVGYRFRVQLLNMTTKAVVADITLVGDATLDTLDEIGTELAVRLNALPLIAAAAYVGATQVLTIAAAGDTLGDHRAIVEVYPPAVLDESGVDITEKVGAPGWVTAITDEGAAGAAVTCTFAADAFVIPRVLAQLRAGV
jgi:hypothetical protein